MLSAFQALSVIGFRAALATCGLACCAGCNKDTTPAAEQPQAPVTSTAAAEPAAGADQPAAIGAGAEPKPATPAAAAAAASSQVSEANFDLALKGSGPFKKGQASTVEVVLDAKDPFKVNDKYPYKFKTEAAEGVKYVSPVIKDEALKLEKKKAVMTVGFTPETAGDKKIAGTFSFSVCTEERCLIEKRNLALSIKVE